jgi:hypothetical protein
MKFLNQIIYKILTCNFILESFSGSIRLTPEGTTIYKTNPKDFTDKLLQEISLILTNIFVFCLLR